LFPHTPSASRTQTRGTQHTALLLLDLAHDKQLPWQYLLTLGITEDHAGGLRIPYHLLDGTLASRHRIRTALVAREGSRWSKGKGEIVAYGLERLEEARKAGYLILVEGESDCWTLRIAHSSTSPFNRRSSRPSHSASAMDQHSHHLPLMASHPPSPYRNSSPGNCHQCAGPSPISCQKG
jgi:hypothetical protein